MSDKWKGALYMKDVRIAIAGSWAFHATEFVERIQKRGDCKVTTAWDCDAVKGKEWADSMGLQFQPDYDLLVQDPEIDAIILTSATVDHDLMTQKAVRAGKHIISEKAPMVTMEGAIAVKQALSENDVIYKVSDPVRKPKLQYLKKMADDGMFGQLTMVVTRNVNDKGLRNTLPERFFNKEESGGGVLMDVGCHGLHALSWFLGAPVECCTVTGQTLPLAMTYGSEDNVAASFRFENGALGVVLSCWSGPRAQEAFHIYGTKGCAHIMGNLPIQYCLQDGVWITVPDSELPAPMPKPMDMWLDTLIYGTPHEEYGIDEAVALTEMVCAAYRAAEHTEKI